MNRQLQKQDRSAEIRHSPSKHRHSAEFWFAVAYVVGLMVGVILYSFGKEYPATPLREIGRWMICFSQGIPLVRQLGARR